MYICPYLQKLSCFLFADLGSIISDTDVMKYCSLRDYNLYSHNGTFECNGQWVTYLHIIAVTEQYFIWVIFNIPFIDLPATNTKLYMSRSWNSNLQSLSYIIWGRAGADINRAESGRIEDNGTHQFMRKAGYTLSIH